MARVKLLLLFASVLALAGVVYWQGAFNVSTPSRPAAVQLQPATPPAPNAVVTAAAPSKAEPAPVPVKKNASAATKKPARVARREAPPAVTAEPRESTAPPVVREVEAAPARETTYERRVADAIATAADDSDRALLELQRLAASEPARPEAYEAMAGISLRNRDYAQARELIGSALAHGGKATFTLIHDHSRGNFESADPKATCVGELTIFADEMKFEAPGDGDRFAANWADVRDAGSNRFFGSGIGGFHVTITAGGKYKNINFAPGSKDKAEAKLILDLLTNYTRRAERSK